MEKSITLYLMLVVLAVGVLGLSLMFFQGKSTTEDFCGISTYGSCETDADCITAGCSSEVCQSSSEEEMVTICDYKECYDASSYGLSCQCVNNQCQWN